MTYSTDGRTLHDSFIPVNQSENKSREQFKGNIWLHLQSVCDCWYIRVTAYGTSSCLSKARLAGTSRRTYSRDLLSLISVRFCIIQRVTTIIYPQTVRLCADVMQSDCEWHLKRCHSLLLTHACTTYKQTAESDDRRSNWLLEMFMLGESSGDSRTWLKWLLCEPISPTTTKNVSTIILSSSRWELFQM